MKWLLLVFLFFFFSCVFTTQTVTEPSISLSGTALRQINMVCRGMGVFPWELRRIACDENILEEGKRKGICQAIKNNDWQNKYSLEMCSYN
jgi:hypothetical protein